LGLVANKLKIGEKGVAMWDGKDITTTKVVCPASSLVGDLICVDADAVPSFRHQNIHGMHV